MSDLMNASLLRSIGEPEGQPPAIYHISRTQIHFFSISTLQVDEIEKARIFFRVTSLYTNLKYEHFLPLPTLLPSSFHHLRGPGRSVFL